MDADQLKTLKAAAKRMARGLPPAWAVRVKLGEESGYPIVSVVVKELGRSRGGEVLALAIPAGHSPDQLVQDARRFVARVTRRLLRNLVPNYTGPTK